MAQAGLIFPNSTAFAHLPLSPGAKLLAVIDSTDPAQNGWVLVGDITTASYDAAARLVATEAAARDAALTGIEAAAAASAIASVLAQVRANVVQIVQQTVAALPPPTPPPLQVPFVIVGLPGAGQVLTIPMAIACQVPADLAGAVVYFDAAATANAVFTLFHVSGATKTVIGTVTVTAGSHTGYVASHQAAVPLAIGDALQMMCPATQDATLANGGITFLAPRT